MGSAICGNFRPVNPKRCRRFALPPQSILPISARTIFESHELKALMIRTLAIGGIDIRTNSYEFVRAGHPAAGRR